LNGDVGGGFQGIQITSGFFQLWRASGITSELQLYSTAIGGLVMAAAMFCWLVGSTTTKVHQNLNGFRM
jgi:photosystem I P700 chlorophyll a apoprotein A1